MNLDISTTKGQQSLQHEKIVQEIIRNKWNVEIIETQKNKPAKCDGFLARNNELIAVFETKCRYDMTYQQLLERQSWLVSYHKILAGKKLSELLQVPFLGFLYLAPKHEENERLLVFWKITDEKGNFCFEFQIAEQETQKTINAEKGTIVRKNAYLPVEHLKLV